MNGKAASKFGVFIFCLSLSFPLSSLFTSRSRNISSIINNNVAIATIQFEMPSNEQAQNVIRFVVFSLYYFFILFQYSKKSASRIERCALFNECLLLFIGSSDGDEEKIERWTRFIRTISIGNSKLFHHHHHIEYMFFKRKKCSALMPVFANKNQRYWTVEQRQRNGMQRGTWNGFNTDVCSCLTVSAQFAAFT